MAKAELPRPYLRRLALHGSLNTFVKDLAEEQLVSQYPFSTDDQAKLASDSLISDYLSDLGVVDQASLDQWCQKYLIDSPAQLAEFVRYQVKKKLIVQRLLAENGETAFLKFKDRLDRVLYSVIRVPSEALAYHLFYALDHGEITFSDAAERFSDGVESRSAGIVGPVDLCTPHPEIASRLKRGRPGELFEPFKADEWFLVVSLLYRFESSYDDISRRTLGQLLFSAKVAEFMPEVSKQLLRTHLASTPV
ncbi:hypothetical protein [Synechococcus sp. GEYO]|uniref:peptidylprolyl isomerase n=1 Tax=Synechococcus sp. GEYO TaxID=2575511 RepID=UPI000E0F15F2|nr:hypothetical protein [Synechococcus sp. GEYO]